MFRLLMLVIIFSVVVLASKNRVGFITEIEGEVIILRDFDKKVPKREIKEVKYDGVKVKRFEAKRYEKLYVNDIIRTGKKSKAKIVLKDKNILFVDEYCKIKIPENNVKRKENSLLDLAFGKVRGIVVKSKKEKLKVTSPAAVMGIRGTDFLMNFSPSKNLTEVSVIKGEVSLKKMDVKEVSDKNIVKKKVVSKEVFVKAGYTAEVKKQPKEVKDNVVSKDEPSVVKIIEPKKITLEKLDEAKVIAMVKTKTEEKPENVEQKKEIEKIKKEAVMSEKAAIKEIEAYNKDKSTADKKEKFDINSSVEKILTKRLKEEGIDEKSYKKVPVELRVKARQKGMKNRELTPRNIREKSKRDPEIKSIFDSYIDVF